MLLSALGLACATERRVETSFGGDSMGTTYHVKVITPGRLTEGTQSEIEEAVRSALDEVDGLMSTYRDDSEVSRFNRAGAGAPFPLSRPTLDVVALALEISRQTEGAFDVTVGPLVEAWGFGRRRTTEPPDPDLVRELSERVGYEKLHLDRDASTLSKEHSGLAIDLSAVAKGYGVDRAAAALERLGLFDYLVEVGGEIRTAGHNRAGQPWRLAVEQPGQAPRRLVHRVLAVTDGALATSGDYRNFYEVDGRRYSHTLDPRTGAPVLHSLASASVLSPDCATADAYATALMVLGPESALRFASRRNLKALLLVYNDEGGVDELLSPEMEAFLRTAPTADD